MNDNTAKLLEKLATKLGTTSEYLWKILIKQAPIDATVDLIKIAFVLLFGFVLWRFHKKFSIKKDRNGYLQSAYKHYDTLDVIMVFLTIFCIGLFFATFVQINSIIHGFYNPEYWALNEVLSNLK